MILEILKKAPKGTPLYSLVIGECSFKRIEDPFTIVVSDDEGKEHFYHRSGRLWGAGLNGERLLFPSKENRNWDNVCFEKFNINTLEPFDKVLVRNKDNHCWTAGLYSHYEDYGEQRFYITNNISWNQCVPYNEETKHLVGTTKMPDNKYINW